MHLYGKSSTEPTEEVATLSQSSVAIGACGIEASRGETESLIYLIVPELKRIHFQGFPSTQIDKVTARFEILRY